MQRVINGKLYDTSKAELIHEWDNEIYGNDPRHCEAALYRTKKGAYFLVGSGGPMSRYAQSHGNKTRGGSGTQVISEQEAIAWLEENDGTEALLKYFSEKIEEA